ncbi:ImmA/IrrE family metallo-endopeptidase [Commensalibacter nepenthis]|uniref:ImmA/IrrE family metallo-endopeptidase n=1 Tax=Commensalibacter nepenthis TaxID=3043872 RepID=A0ABT6Q853_9PROT|nr:ImmA/IrrE family metallo-endopeptidase [Commensalibacter sp. TBRC 10068]MDI2113080.1 ImmA/IrrE family metallo-endopeptidase [Commensalibacter sp. TBRC 10068]
MAKQLLETLPDQTKKLITRYLDMRPVPLGKIAKEFGVKVFTSPLEQGISGQIAKENGDFVIRINKYESRQRQRFTLAHELAHYFLHKDIIENEGPIKDNILYRSGKSDTVEAQANRLAAEIIMPDEKIKSDLNQLRKNMDEETFDMIASKWEVSNQALRIKLSTVGG